MRLEPKRWTKVTAPLRRAQLLLDVSGQRLVHGAVLSEKGLQVAGQRLVQGLALRGAATILGGGRGTEGQHPWPRCKGRARMAPPRAQDPRLMARCSGGDTALGAERYTAGTRAPAGPPAR